MGPEVTDYLVALGTLVGTLLGVFGLVYKMTSDMRKYCEVGMKALDEKREEGLKSVYKRFDQYKKSIEESHVSKEVCGILHNQIVEDVVEIKADVKELLGRIPKSGDS